jgi:glycine/D-amino acid oxidase-like deaminating enzyme/nitrite reductase/ring-hydroxylating ferredoxin subunit
MEEAHEARIAVEPAQVRQVVFAPVPKPKPRRQEGTHSAIVRSARLTAGRRVKVDDVPESYWVASTPPTSYAPLDGDVEGDVAVVGGGITGLTAAALLQRAGRNVVVVEHDRIASGASGYNTAKLTSGHNLVYERLLKRFGEAKTRLYAQANESAIDFVEAQGIECDFRRPPNFVYAAAGEDPDAVRREAEACARVGLPASFVTETTLPYPVLGAVRLERQAEFHPRKYLLGLAARFVEGGGTIHEQTTALEVDDGDPATVRTSRGAIRAQHVIVASHLPFADRGLFFAKAPPSASYALIAPVDPAAAPEGMFINTGQPSRSIRVVPDGDRTLLLVGGEGHVPGAERDTRRRYAALEDFLRRHWDAGEVEQRWYTMDYVSVDEVPFVGPLTPRSRHLWTATGYRKWGLSNGTAAGMLLADLALGRESPWAGLYDAHRRGTLASTKLYTENAKVGARFFGDRLAPRFGSVDAIAPGEGTVLRVRGRQTAVHRDDDGALHALSPVCTHLRCLVRWNTAERSWDCPCHGSRFDPRTGAVLHGPAVEPLARRPL